MEAVASTVVLQSELADFWVFLDDLETLEERLLATAVVVFVALVLVRAVLPPLVALSSQFYDRRVHAGRLRDATDLLSAYVPTTLSRLALVGLQLGVAYAAASALLVVWNQVETARSIVLSSGISSDRVVQVGLTFGLFGVAYVASTVLKESVKQYSEGADQITDHQQEIIVRLGNVGILSLVIASALTLWGLNLSGLLVGAGFLGIVVGMAARQTLGSMIAGFVLMFSRPFTIGDWVEVGGNEGIVTGITIMNTRLQNFDGESIVIPNDTVSNQPITNRSTNGHLRLRLDVGVDYETDAEHAERVALGAITGTKPVSDSPKPQVVPKSFGDSAVVLELRFWIDHPTPARKWRAIGEVVEAVKTAFEAEGIKIPYPQRELSGRAETGGFRVHGSMRRTDTRDEVEASPED
jgi:small-conductance mechanosensitive channel